MGRGRIELKKIENVNRLQVSFTNRRKVLMKKANDLSILCSLLSSSPTPARFTISLAACNLNTTILFILRFWNKINFLGFFFDKKNKADYKSQGFVCLRTREDLRSVVESIMSIAQNITHQRFKETTTTILKSLSPTLVYNCKRLQYTSIS